MSDVHNQLKQAPEISLAIRRMFGGDSGLSVERLSETLQPIVDIWSHPWCAWLRNERLWSAGTAQGAVAAEFSFCAVASPVDGGMIVVVEHASFRTPTAGEVVLLGRASDNLVSDASSGVSLRDARGGAVIGGRTMLRRGASAATAVVNSLGRARNQSANEFTAFDKLLPVVLIPGTALLVEHQTLNIALEANFAGYERALVPGELV